MLTFERHQQILDLLETKRFVTVEQLCAQLFASGATIRRDLAEMEKRGLITRVRGGAVAGDVSQGDKPYLLRSGENREKKLAICSIAKQLIAGSATLMMDSSSTAALLASTLGDVRGLSVVTNGLRTVISLVENTDARVYCTGGIIQDSSSMWGQTAVSAISQYHADLMFFSCKGFEPSLGATESSEENAQIKRHMLRAAKRKVLLADTSKFGKQFFCKICAAADIDYIVTDKAPPEEYLRLFPGKFMYPK